MFDMTKRNDNTIARLTKELQSLKSVNKELYRVNKKELTLVVNCMKQGVSCDRISQMIKALPESFLPDEADIMLYQHMNTLRDTKSHDRAEKSSKKFDSINSLSGSI